MHLVESIVQSDENQIVSYETAGDEWVIKVVDWHGVVIDSQLFVEIYFILFNFPRIPCGLSKGPHFKHPVIHKHGGIYLSR